MEDVRGIILKYFVDLFSPNGNKDMEDCFVGGDKNLSHETIGGQNVFTS